MAREQARSTRHQGSEKLTERNFRLHGLTSKELRTIETAEDTSVRLQFETDGWWLRMSVDAHTTSARGRQQNFAILDTRLRLPEVQALVVALRNEFSLVAWVRHYLDGAPSPPRPAA